MTQTGPSGTLSLRWKTLSVVLAIVTLACLTSTVIVASIRDVDALSVVALALAIIAFVVQILVYIVQSASTESQRQHWTDLYTKMNAALATIEEKSERTRDAVSRLDPQQIKQAVDKATSEATAIDPRSNQVEASSTREEIASSISERVVELLAPQSRETPIAPSRSNQPRRWQNFTEVPISRPEIEWASEVAESLSDIELLTIRSLGEDQKFQESAGMDHIGFASINSAEQLHAKGLVARRKATWSPNPVFQLTPEGVLVAHLLLSPPTYALELETYRAAKAKLDALDEMSKQFRKERERESDTIPLSD